jgi:uncharacterized protein (DUF58 family)
VSPDLLRAAYTSASVCAEKLRLPLRSRVWKGQAGEFLGAGVGSSLDFQDHRAYVPGDDPRHINWQAYARTGQFTMKLYREEVRPVVDLVLDVSESMFFEPVKARRSCELLYFLVESATRTGASLQIHLVTGSQLRPIPFEAVSTHRWFEDAQTLQKSDPNAPPDLAAIPFRANAFRVLLSDLLFPGDPAAMIRLLGQRQGSPVLFAPFTRAEANPDWHGNYEFIEAELHTRHPHRIEPAVLNRYKKAYANHFSIWKTACRRYNAALARVGADPDLESALHEEAVPAGALELTN